MVSVEFEPPKYLAVAAGVKDRIRHGEFGRGEQLPSESALVREYGAGRTTVVRALQILRAEGWIDREHGRGSFVKAVPRNPETRRGIGETEFVQPEDTAGAEFVSAETREAPSPVCLALGVPEGTPLLLRRKFVHDDGAPKAVVSLWFPVEVAEETQLAHSRLLRVSVRQHLSSERAIRTDRVVERLAARFATAEQAQALKLDDGSPVLHAFAVLYDTSDRGVVVAEVVVSPLAEPVFEYTDLS